VKMKRSSDRISESVVVGSCRPSRLERWQCEGMERMHLCRPVKRMPMIL
jgi:hypothetical protein